MMKNVASSGLIPVFTTEAGRCLTHVNWQEAGIKMASYHLTELLMKPGLPFLYSLPNLAIYTGWKGTSVINASMPSANRDGIVTLRSDYDGSRISLGFNEILTLIARLQPHMTVLPQGMMDSYSLDWQSLSDSMLIFYPVSDLSKAIPGRPYGVYFAYDKTTEPSALLHDVAQYTHLPRYIAGDMTIGLMRDLVACGVEYIESNQPAFDACRGMVYTHEKMISLSDDEVKMVFQPIDHSCYCPTCCQQFSRAYLHHLLEHTPLLCQRFLIQHNVHYCQTSIF